MRKLTSGVDKGKFVRLETEKTSKKLENEQTRNLSDMPSSITLNRQPYRHVDNVCFSNREIMERFLEEWRNTGQQQVGWLMGKYVKYDEVPLGIKVRLFIWQEVLQESFISGGNFETQRILHVCYIHLICLLHVFYMCCKLTCIT